jgi:hypothetical protein
MGVQQNKLKINVQGSVMDCYVSIYLNVFLGESTNFIACLPINMQGVKTLKGTLSFQSSQPLPQSSIITINETSITEGSLSDHFKALGSNTVHVDSKILYQKSSDSSS